MILDFFIDRLTEENYPQVQVNRCLYGLKNECTSCLDNCPEGAITLNANQVILDQELCNRCGICKSICPTQAVFLKGIGEENILRNIKDKRNIIFSCSNTAGVGNLKINCLNALHPELLAALFILFADKIFYFYIGRCENCNLGDTLLKNSLDKAVSFVTKLGVEPKYELCTDENKIRELSEEIMSRRDLFLFLKKGTTNIASQAVDTILSDDSQLSIRKVLLKSIETIELDLPLNNIEFFQSFRVNDDCNGCADCQSICPGQAWKVENDEQIKVEHNPGRCFKCGLCTIKCSQGAIDAGPFNKEDLYRFNLKKEIKLNTCTMCEKKFFSKSDTIDICPVCEKKTALRKKLATD